MNYFIFASWFFYLNLPKYRTSFYEYLLLFFNTVESRELGMIFF